MFWKCFLRYWECLRRPCCWWWGGCSPSVPLASTLDLHLRRMALHLFHHLWELDLDCWSLCLWLHWLFHHCWCSRQDQPWARKWDHYRIKFHPAWGLQCLHPSQWYWTCGAPNPSYLQWYALKSSTLKQHTLSHVFCLQTMFVWLACLPTQWKETPLRMSLLPSPDGASFPTALLERPLSKFHFQIMQFEKNGVIYCEYTNFSGLTMLKDSVWCPMMIVLLLMAPLSGREPSALTLSRTILELECAPETLVDPSTIGKLTTDTCKLVLPPLCPAAAVRTSFLMDSPGWLPSLDGLRTTPELSSLKLKPNMNIIWIENWKYTEITSQLEFSLKLWLFTQFLIMLFFFRVSSSLFSPKI